jgi:hypothetical protein
VPETVQNVGMIMLLSETDAGDQLSFPPKSLFESGFHSQAARIGIGLSSA